MSQSKYNKPLIFNTYKPKDISSYDVVRHFKRNLPKGFGKIGHFGTLDPFAQGILMIGINGAAKLNNFIHDFLPKTYIATGLLGSYSETGDLTEGVSQTDESEYLTTVISQFDKDFIEKKLVERFLGTYMQAPHKYSAAKFEGKALHAWAREGVEIKKDLVEREVYKIKVLDYAFPELKIEFEVSSGTYIRTLFSDCAKFLGTIGVLKDLQRTIIGGCNLDNCINQKNWAKEQDESILNLGLDVREVLAFGKVIFDEKEARLYSNGVALKENRALDRLESQFNSEYFWVEDKNSRLLGLCRLDKAEYRAQFNFH